MINIFILAIISALLVFLYYRRTNPPISKSLKWLLAILRFLFFLIILIILITPILNLNKKRTQQPLTAIANDISSSMTQRQKNEMSKAEFEDEWNSKLQDFLDKNAIKYKNYDFSNGLDGDTNRTDIFLSLSQIQKKERDKNLADIILISDGLNHNNNNFTLLKEINKPISVVILGENPEYVDISIRKVLTNNPIFLNTETEVQITVEGLKKGQDIEVSLYKKNSLISRKKFKDVQGLEEISLAYTPRSLGFKKMRVTVELEKVSEINLNNNKREFLLNVVKDKAQIAIITSQLNWDVTFIHRALKKNEKLKVNLIEKRKDGYYLENDEISVSDIVTNCDLLILGNSDEFHFSNSVYKEIKNFIKRGGNLIYLDKIDDELNDILPLGKSKYKEGVTTTILLTNLADNYQTFTIGDSEKNSQELWATLPPIITYFYTAQKNTEVIAVANLPTKNPVLAFSNYFNGHILMFAGNGLYRWKMWENPTNKWFDEFVNSIVNWLINTDIKKRFICSTDKLEYLEGEPIDFSALLFDEKMNTIPKQDILLKITNDNEVIEKYLTEKDNEYFISVDGLKQGKYNYRAECILGNNLLISEGGFLIDSVTLEESTTGLNNSFLKFVASQTDGKVIKTENDFKELLAIQRRVKQIVTTKEMELWKKWYIPVIAIFLISLELFIRKRKGLL